MGRSVQRTCGSSMVKTSREQEKVEMSGIPTVQRVSNEQMNSQTQRYEVSTTRHEMAHPYP
ncbi:hypothetical protein C0J52_06690 [Blattella germanica]|nr:hypothetical protein C0J52_06690 [Blattella germanica]